MSTLTVEDSCVTTEIEVVEPTIVVTPLSPTVAVEATPLEQEVTSLNTTVTPEVLEQTIEVIEEDIEVVVSTPTIIQQVFSGGGATTFSVTAGEALGGHRVVYIADGEAFYADLMDVTTAGQIAGVTVAAASMGQAVAVQSAGLLEEPTWTFVPGPVYVGANGTLTQTRPVAGYIINIGVAVSATELLIHRTSSIEVI